MSGKRGEKGEEDRWDSREVRGDKGCVLLLSYLHL